MRQTGASLPERWSASTPHAIRHARGVGGLELDDGIYDVFAISDARGTRIDDYTDQAAARAAAGKPAS